MPALSYLCWPISQKGIVTSSFRWTGAPFSATARRAIPSSANTFSLPSSRALIRMMVRAGWTRSFAQLVLQGWDVQVLVRDNNVDQALRALKKKLQREGVFREMKLRDHYEKPSEKRAREKAEAVRRARKVARKRAQRDGLLPVKAKPVR
jgi:small subunit ribosomal protein S21